MSSAKRVFDTDTLVLLAAIVAAVAVLSFRLDWQRFNWDEYVTLLFTRFSWYTLMVENWGLDTHRPVYYGLQKIWNMIVGEDNRALIRGLPVVLTVSIIPLFFVAARHIQPGSMALLAVLLLPTAPMFIDQGRELRMYCLMNFALSAALLCVVLLAHRAKEQEAGAQMRAGATTVLWAVCMGLLALAFYAQAAAIFIPLLLVLWAVGCAVFGALPRFFLWQCLGGGALYLVFIAPALYPFLQHYNNSLVETWWIPEPTLRYVYDHTSGAYPYPAWAKPTVAVLLLWGLWSLSRSKPHFAALLAALLVGFPAFILAVSFFKPIYMTRVIAWSSFVSILVLAAGLANLRPLWRWGGAAVLVTAQVMALLRTYPDAYEPQLFTGDFTPHFEAFDPATDHLIMENQRLEVPLRWYYPHVFERQTYGFRYDELNKFVIAPILRSSFVLRPDASALSALDGTRLFIFQETRRMSPEEDLDPSLAAVRDGRSPDRVESSKHFVLEIFDLKAVSP